MKGFANVHTHLKSDSYADGVNFLDTLFSVGITDVALHGLIEMFGSLRNIATLYWKSKYNKINISAFGGFHRTDIYGNIPVIDQAEKLLSMGCDGIKIIEMKPSLRKKLGPNINTDEYHKMFSMLEERDIPVLMHVGDPYDFWDIEKINPDFVKRGWYYGDGSYPEREQFYKETFEMLDAHKNLRIILAHMFFLAPDIERAAQVLDTYPNVSFDLTPYRDMYLIFSKEPEKWHDFFEKYSDRIMFGTDAADNSTETEGLHNLVYDILTKSNEEYDMPTRPGFKNRGLYLSEKTVENICYNNFMRFTGNKIKKVDTDMLGNEIEKMISDFSKSNGNPLYVQLLNEYKEGLKNKKI